MMLSARNSSPFTATQWQELEHQALIFKYMMAGIPIPPDLIYSVKNSLMDSSSSSLSAAAAAARLFSHQPPVGWGCFQVGFGRKTDPEPGRCRRTDGKKWRCSKEAYPDSKYCERHMHRGKNRSRKPVELPTTTSSPPLSQPPQQSLSSFSLYPSLSSSSQSSPSIETSHHPYYHNNSNNQNQNQNQNSSSPVFPFLYPPLQSSCSSVSRPTPSSDFSSQNNNSTTTHQLFLDSASNYSHQSDKDYRYFNGMRESLDERVFFPEASGTLIRSLQHQQQQQEQQQQEQQQQQQHCFVLGTDFKSSMIKAGKNDNNNNDVHHDDETQKQMHHFFSEWPQKNRDSWLDLEDHDDPSSTRTHSSFSSATQLSISLPMSASHHDPFAPHSRLHPDG